jgi:hypothetical protein
MRNLFALTAAGSTLALAGREPMRASSASASTAKRPAMPTISCGARPAAATSIPDLAHVIEHAEPLPHPAQDRTQ